MLRSEFGENALCHSVENSPCLTCESKKITQIKSKYRHGATKKRHSWSFESGVFITNTLDAKCWEFLEFMTGPLAGYGV